MTNTPIEELTRHNQDLANHLAYLKKHHSNLQKQLDQITTSKAYLYWQRLNAAKKNLLSFAFVKRMIPFEFKQYLRSLSKLAETSQERQERNQFKKYLDAAVTKQVKKSKIVEKVSLVIPTKNAGPEFDSILKKIVSQKHLSELEVILVDSGSTDQTLAYAKKHGVTIVKMKPEEFSHSKSRNLGARSATGKYIVFTVQDAHLLNDSTLCDSINFLKQNKVSACTARQIPRSDTDIFSSWQISNFVDFICPKKQDLIIDIDAQSFAKLTSVNKRSFCTLDDVFAVYEKKFFDAVGGYEEALTYGEDLEMGKRLIENGYTLGFLYSNGVVHSHNRPASYFLKRYYVDSVFLHKVFEDKTAQYSFGDVPLKDLIENLYSLGLQLQDNCNSMSVFKSISDTKKPTHPLLLESTATLAGLKTALNLKRSNTKLNASLKKEMEFFIDHTLGMLNKSWSLSSSPSSDLISLTDKIFSIFVSGHLSRYYLSNEKKSAELVKLHTFLSQGV